jgi:hypothetical protein
VAVLEWKEKLDDYPVADDEDFSDREYKATIENIENEGSITEGEAQKVFTWLWDNNQRAVEARDGGGGYPSSEEIQKALLALGLRKPEEEEEDEEAEGEPPPPEPPYNDPNQTWFWPEVGS